MYTYGELLDDINYLSRCGAETGCIGASGYGRLIPYAALGAGEHAVVITAGIHAREHVSSLFVVKQIYKLSKTELPCRLYFVPMVNPDGNILIAEGADAFGFDKAKLLALNGGNPDFSLWKANAAGVDLNVNFDAKWGEGKHNVRQAGGENYIGAAPFSEPETQALARFTRSLSPVLTLSYHAKGREIYYDFHQRGKARERDAAVARHAAACTDYALIEGTQGSAGGYKDWCVAALGIPALTLELASDELSHPLPDDSITQDFARAFDLPVRLYAFMKTQNYV